MEAVVSWQHSVGLLASVALRDTSSLKALLHSGEMWLCVWVFYFLNFSKVLGGKPIAQEALADLKARVRSL